MRKIDKDKNEPKALSDWKKENPNGNYGQLTHIERQSIRVACRGEQYFLCAYCCQSIRGELDDTVIEHVEAQSISPHRGLDYGNMVLSCRTTNQCDHAHGNKALLLTPLMDECETELKFGINGRVEGLTKRAKICIDVLNLGDKETKNRALIEKRKQLSRRLLWANGVNPDEGLDDDKSIRKLISILKKPQDGKLRPFAPVVVNILTGWLS